MKKKSLLKLIAYILIIIFMVLAFGFLSVGTDEANEGYVKYKQTVRVIDGSVSEPESFTPFSVKADGNYILRFSLLPEGVSKDDVGSVAADDLGFITTVLVTDSYGAVRYSSVQGAIYLDTVVYLEEGDYYAGFIVHTGRDEFLEYASENFLSRKEAEMIADASSFDSFPDNTEQVMEYEFSYESEAENSRIVAGIVALILGIVLMLVLIVREILIMSGADVHDKYDERQKLEQGKGFKLGFFTLLIELGIVMCIDCSGLIPDSSAYVFYGGALFISITVYAVYCIWHESYFAINRTGKGTIIMLAVICLMNLLICIGNGLSGLIIINGVPTFRILNVYCVIAFLIVFIAMILKKISNGISESSEDEEE